MSHAVIAPAVRKPCVLIVDDDRWTADMMRVALEGDGYAVQVAETGRGALNAVEQVDPDLILLDVRLPDMDGYEVCRRLKQNAQSRFLPIILVTALRGFDERIRGLHAGADSILVKPWHHQELLTRVQSLVRMKRVYDEVHTYRDYLEEQVTERTIELEQALAKLQDLNRMKSQFISNVSHELRTPLVYIKGPIDMLADGLLGSLTAEQVQAVQSVSNGIRQLERVIGDMLTFGQAQREPMELEPVDLEPVAYRIMDLLAPIATEAEVTLRLDLPDDLPQVCSNAQGLAIVIRHLVENAVKFSQPGSEVTITARPTADRQQIEITVIDRGIGIPPDQLEHIFEPFYQVDGSSTRRFGGTGLGLALVRLILEALNSSVDVHSQPGQGSRFTFRVPVASPGRD